jgi:hypothetical protein
VSSSLQVPVTQRIEVRKASGSSLMLARNAANSPISGRLEFHGAMRDSAQMVIVAYRAALACP